MLHGTAVCLSESVMLILLRPCLLSDTRLLPGITEAQREWSTKHRADPY